MSRAVYARLCGSAYKIPRPSQKLTSSLKTHTVVNIILDVMVTFVFALEAAFSKRRQVTKVGRGLYPRLSGSSFNTSLVAKQIENNV